MPRCFECGGEVEPPVGLAVVQIGLSHIRVPAHEECVIEEADP